MTIKNVIFLIPKCLPVLKVITPYSKNFNLHHFDFFKPRFASTFFRSPFFFLTYIGRLRERITDILNVETEFQPLPECLIFPDANDLKVSVFRRLTHQKRITQNLIERFRTNFDVRSTDLHDKYLVTPQINLTHRRNLTINYDNSSISLW